MMVDFARILIVLGVVCVVAGAVLLLLPRGFNPLAWFGRLPGDIWYQGEHTSVFIPLTSMLVVSLVLSGFLWLYRALF
jgi:hypothetical protein